MSWAMTHSSRRLSLYLCPRSDQAGKNEGKLNVAQLDILQIVGRQLAEFS